MSTRPDGRDTRWKAHRTKRRAELVESAIRAIRAHGASVGMDEIATVAGTSKTVIYRHLGDRMGLYFAVCEAVDALILSDFDRALAQAAATPGSSDDRAEHAGAEAVGPGLRSDVRPVLVAAIDSYLRLVERDPELYRFVIRRPLVDVPPEQDPVSGLTDAIAARLKSIFLAAMSPADETAASVWAHGLVGFVREAGDRWLAQPDRPAREKVVGHLADFAAVGLVGVIGSNEGPPATSPANPTTSHPKPQSEAVAGGTS